MFCLRSWIPILFFLTNASPIYLLLFISATYILNRPCVYCSLLLAILVLSLFDFHTNWFEPRYASTSLHPHNSSSSFSSSSPTTGSTTPPLLPTALASTIELLASAGSRAVVDVLTGQALENAVSATGVGGRSAPVVEWVKGVFRREWRVPCLDVVVRL